MRSAERLLRFAGRWRRRAPDRMVAAALALASMMVDASGPSLLLPRVRRVLVLAPHPDDETIGCGGLTRRLVDTGTRVEVALVTDGEATIGAPGARPAIAARRRVEASVALRRLGTRPPRCLGIPDGSVAEHHDELVALLAAVLAETRPQLVLTPWAMERHADHRATTRALVDALTHGAPHPERIWGYEVHTPILTPTHVLDISPAVEVKRAALADHRTAAGAFDLTATLGLDRWRSLSTRGGSGAAEAFHEADLRELTRLLGVADLLWSPDPVRGRAGAPARDGA